jgi:hypothetical protein
MAWSLTNASFIWIFPVGRGNCAFLRTGLNHGFILDMGEEGEFDISEFIKKEFVPDLTKYPDASGNRIAQAVLSHPHEDHIKNCETLKEQELAPHLITCPNEKTESEKFNWERHGNPKGTEALIETYKSLYAARTPPLQSIKYDGQRSVPNMEYGLYYVRPPVCEELHGADTNKYGNATSIMFYFRHGTHSILFPGDMTPEGMKTVLFEKKGAEKRFTRFSGSVTTATQDWHLKTGSQPSLRSMLATHGLTVLVAPHHGLESCYCSELYDAIKANDRNAAHKPQLVVVSERIRRHDNDGTTDSRYYGEKGGTGVTVTEDGKVENGKTFLSTKGGHHILIIFNGTGPVKVHIDTEPDNLLPLIKSSPAKVGSSFKQHPRW